MAAEESKVKGRRSWIALGAISVIAVAGFFAWRALLPREGTDDAQVSGHVSPVATRVGGTVRAITVEDNQAVKAGDVLVELDARDYQLAVAKAEADLAAAEAAARGCTERRADYLEQRAQRPTGRTGCHWQRRRRLARRRARSRGLAREGRVGGSASRGAAGPGDARRPGFVEAGAARGQGRDPAAATRHRHRRQAGADAAVSSADADVREAKANLDVAEARRAQAEGMVAQSQSQARAADTAPQQIALIEARASGADAQVLLARAALDQARAQSRAHDRARAGRRHRQPPHRRDRPGRAARPAADGHHVARRRVGDGQLQGNAAAIAWPPASAPRSKSTPTAADATPGTSKQSPPRPARRSACCRRTTRAATS